MSTVYYDPLKHGVSVVAEVDWTEEHYQHDKSIVWRRKDGALVMADSSGCSCTSPFEDSNPWDLTPVTAHEAAAALQAELARRKAEGESWLLSDNAEGRVARAIELIMAQR